MFRIINSKIWEDDWFFDLSAEQKLLFMYLVTSPHTDQLGIFKANIKYISIETGLKDINSLLKSLYPKVIYIPELKLIFIKNFLRYQNVGGKFEKLIYNKFLELSNEVKAILIKENEYLKNIIEKYNQELIKEIEAINYQPINVIKDTPSMRDKEENEIKDAPLMGDRWGIDGAWMGHPTESDTESESEIYISESETESGKLKKNIDTANAERVQPQNKSSPSKRKKVQKPKKYPPEVINFVGKFKEYRENYLKIPITHRDWHLKAYALTAKLLKKYSLAELTQALEDLQSQAWEDKATKIIELWHFEDWLPRWKIWKNSRLKTRARPKTEDEIIEEELEKIRKWKFADFADYEWEVNKKILFEYRKENGSYPFPVPSEILGGENNGI